MHGVFSTVHELPGGGPLGSTLGQISYLSQSTSSAQDVPEDQRFKFVDDLTMLEIVNLVSIGISTYNFKNHVASDIEKGQKYVNAENLQSQEYLNKISQWTHTNKMKLNVQKSNILIFNESRNFQFSTRLQLENFILDILDNTKLLGVIISSDLTWHKNTKSLVSKGYQRIIILKKLFEFNVPMKDLINIYVLFIRSLL